VVTYTRRASSLLALIPYLAACGSGEAANPIRVAFAEETSSPITSSSVVFRFPTDPGPGVRLYTFPRIEELDWRFDTPGLATRQVVGFAAAERQIYVQTRDSGLVALDLEGGLDHSVDSAVVAAAIGPTGTLHLVGVAGALGTVVDRHAQRWENSLPEEPQRVWGTTRGRLLALMDTDRGRRLDLLSRAGPVTSIDVPAGPLAVTRWGDLMVVATDSGLVALRTEPTGSRNIGFRPVTSDVTALTFSAAGHHLFVATANRELLVINRFLFDGDGEAGILRRYPTTHRVQFMRTGPQGRFLLLKPEGIDSLWIADAVELTTVVTVAGSWEEDLPDIAADGTVLVRQGDDVVAIDPATGTQVGRVEDAAGDRWLAISWDPRRPTLQLAQETETDPAEEPTEGEDPYEYYAQLSSTSNEAWALARRDELRGAQLPAQVIYPDEYYDRYRVVLGPYPTREDAHNIGRRLGQPYFVLMRQQDTTATNR
jgi:outer membrane protein assembly factor BamB